MPTNLNGTIDTGAMKVNTLVETVELLCGQRYQIANGFQSGQSIVKCSSLADQTPGTATNDHIALGSSGYVNGKLITGSLPVREYLTDRASKGLNSDGSITLGFPRGIYMTKHPSYGYPVVRISQSELITTAGLTAAKIAKGKTYLGVAGTYTSDATAAASDMKKGKTAFSNGVLITGTLIAQSPSNISAQTNGPASITLSWYNPSIGPFAGVQIRMSTSGYPGKTGGSVVYTGAGSNTARNGKSSVAITRLNGNTEYYFTVYGQCGTLDTSEGYLNVSAKTAVSRGSQTFLTSGIFTVPQYVYNIEYCIVGAGGSTYKRGDDDSTHTWANGGAGGYVVNGQINVTPGQQLAVTIGAPAVFRLNPFSPSYDYSFAIMSRGDHPSRPTPDTPGWTWRTNYSTSDYLISGSSMINNIEAKGGMGMYDGSNCGAAGGSGAGATCGGGINGSVGSGAPGSNGSDGGIAIGSYEGYDLDDYGTWYLCPGGKGQGKTTKAFGDANGTLYSTAGNGAVYGQKCSAGADNTGNGATGGGFTRYNSEQAAGGSGIVLIRWGDWS